MSKWSYFSDPSELNALPKNISGVPKIGDQRSIVDFFGLYNEDEDAEFDLNSDTGLETLKEEKIVFTDADLLNKKQREEKNDEEITRNKKTIINKIIKKIKSMY